MKVSGQFAVFRIVPIRAALTAIIAAILLSQIGCQELTPEEAQRLDEYRRSNIGGGGAR
jgi:hypothetical protein